LPAGRLVRPFALRHVTGIQAELIAGHLYLNNISEGGVPLSIEGLCTWANDELDLTLSIDAMTWLVKNELGFAFKHVKGKQGYYYLRASAPATTNHRTKA
jgi:Tfp pilus assembly protein PilN